MIGAIYADRQFVVRDVGQQSARGKQTCGISQGCPLSPYLFVIMMTVLMSAAKSELVQERGVCFGSTNAVNEVVFADDTLFLDVAPENLHAFMTSIGKAGLEYGLSFNWSKLELECVRSDAVIRKPGGSPVVSKDRMVYLGSLLSGVN